MPARLWSLVFDSNDRLALARFWAETLGWKDTHGDGYSTVNSDNGVSPRLEFVSVTAPKTSKNRLHIDVTSDSQEHQSRTVERLIGLGARQIDIGQPEDAAHVVLADPEGNEFCVVPRGDFFTDTGRIGAIAYDAATPALGRFWSEAIGWPVVYESGQYIGIRAPNGTGPYITFGPPVARKTSKNRLHLDIAPTLDGDQELEVQRLEALGATRIDIGQGDVSWVVMADPDGNEFCVLTPR